MGEALKNEEENWLPFEKLPIEDKMAMLYMEIKSTTAAVLTSIGIIAILIAASQISQIGKDGLLGMKIATIIAGAFLLINAYRLEARIKEYAADYGRKNQRVIDREGA